MRDGRFVSVEVMDNSSRYRISSGFLNVFYLFFLTRSMYCCEDSLKINVIASDLKKLQWPNLLVYWFL